MSSVEAVLGASPDGLLLIDGAGQITYCNGVARRLLGINRDPVGHRPIEAIPVIEVHQLLWSSLEGGDPDPTTCLAGPYDLRLWLRRVDEDTLLLTVHDETVFHDAVRARTDFVANVSHELRTPMTAIMGYSETLLQDRDRLPEDLVPLAETLYRNSRRLRDLFEDLLELHRIETRRRQLPLEYRALRPVLEEACVLAADRAADQSQHFQLRCDPGLHGWVNGEALQAIVSNLAQNACAYTPEAGHISVTALEEPDGGVVIHVTDDGIGIDVVHQRRIFERFYRVDRGRSRRHGGTGLGLAIVKHLAQASGCEITLKSQLGKGSQFSVHLPRSGRPA